MATRSNAGRRFPPEVLTRAEVLALMDACGDSPAGVRNRAMIALLYRTGLRITEALALEPKDMNLDVGAIRVLQGKGGRARTVGIDPGAAKVVAAWLVVRSGWLTCSCPERRPVFCTRDGSPLYDGYARVLVPRLGRKAGILKRVHAHGLRHTHAAELREEGVDIGIISKQLGHRSISTTALYLDHLAPWAVVTTIQERSWSTFSMTRRAESQPPRSRGAQARSSTSRGPRKSAKGGSPRRCVRASPNGV